MYCKKAISLALTATLGVSLLAGCGSPSTSSSSGSSGGGTGSTGTSLRFLDTSPSPARQEYYEGIFEKVKAEFGIEVTYESTPLEDAANKITVMAQANSLPDILTTQDNWKGQFTASGWIVPLEDFIGDTADEYADTVTKIVWANEQEMYGHIYTIPDGMMVKGIFVRSDWAEDAGVELSYDWDYDEYFEVIEKLTDPSQNHYGMTYRGTRGAFDVLMTYLCRPSPEAAPMTTKATAYSARMTASTPSSNTPTPTRRALRLQSPSTGALSRWSITSAAA